MTEVVLLLELRGQESRVDLRAHRACATQPRLELGRYGSEGEIAAAGHTESRTVGGRMGGGDELHVAASLAVTGARVIGDQCSSAVLLRNLGQHGHRVERGAALQPAALPVLEVQVWAGAAASVSDVGDVLARGNSLAGGHMDAVGEHVTVDSAHGGAVDTRIDDHPVLESDSWPFPRGPGGDDHPVECSEDRRANRTCQVIALMLPTPTRTESGGVSGCSGTNRQLDRAGDRHGRPGAVSAEPLVSVGRTRHGSRGITGAPTEHADVPMTTAAAPPSSSAFPARRTLTAAPE